MRRLLAPAGALVLSASLGVMAAETVSAPPAAAVDNRQLVSMPPGAQELLRGDMIDYMVALNEILARLAAEELPQAGEVAEVRLGVSSMGRHRGTGMGPGRFMPPEMHQLGIGMHQAATEFAKLASEDDRAEVYAALVRVTSFCVGCHLTFRIR